MKSDSIVAINQVCAEKGISKEVVFSAIEAALISAYRRDHPEAASQTIVVRLNRQSGDDRVCLARTVVEDVRDPRTEVSLQEARSIRPDARYGEAVETDVTPQNFGRIAAQTAKQVVLQRLRESERDLVFNKYKDKEGDIIIGMLQKIEQRAYIVDLGDAEAVMPPTEQVSGETYTFNRRMKFYVSEVNKTPKGTQIVLSRAHRNLVRRLFEMEVPEIFNGTVEIKSIAREPGSRSKVAVAARQENVDPVGSCVGMRGVRIQNIVNELGGEKIDVIQWSVDPAAFVAHALSPAQVVSVTLDESDKTANVVVPERQLSLAIGREGQNARLAARLTGWRIDIKAAAAPRVEERPRADETGSELGSRI
jgi:transcription termination/antitermination protein NusA